MRKIDKGYAIIYIDDEGESLKHDDFEFGELGNVYYKTPGNIQWNYYLIVPNEYFTTSEQLDDFLENDKYTRKYVMRREEINSFIEEMFPDLKEEHGVIELVKGKNRSDSLYKAIQKRLELELGNKYISISSFMRDDSAMETLTNMDKLRAKLIKEPESKYIFYTHISNEMNLAEKKFKLFINQENENG